MNLKVRLGGEGYSGVSSKPIPLPLRGAEFKLQPASGSNAVKRGSYRT
jgi:hypothetical protein